MAVHKFKVGDPVYIANEKCLYYAHLQGKICTFQHYWDARYSLHNPCDVVCPGLTGPYGYPALALCADDLVLVESEKAQDDQSNDTAQS